LSAARHHQPPAGWLNGEWDIAAGQFFTTFRRDVHVVDQFDDKRAVEWSAALDYGFTHYTVVLLGCLDADGNLFVVDEHAERKWLPDRHAAAVKAMLARHGLAADRLRRFVAGADVFSKQSDGSTVASQYARLGITLRPANMERVGGWAEILQRLGDVEAGITPRLFIRLSSANMATRHWRTERQARTVWIAKCGVRGCSLHASLRTETGQAPLGAPCL